MSYRFIIRIRLAKITHPPTGFGLSPLFIIPFDIFSEISRSNGWIMNLPIKSERFKYNMSTKCRNTCKTYRSERTEKLRIKLQRLFGLIHFSFSWGINGGLGAVIWWCFGFWLKGRSLLGISSISVWVFVGFCRFCGSRCIFVCLWGPRVIVGLILQCLIKIVLLVVGNKCWILLLF